MNHNFLFPVAASLLALLALGYVLLPLLRENRGVALALAGSLVAVTALAYLLVGTLPTVPRRAWPSYSPASASTTCSP